MITVLSPPQRLLFFKKPRIRGKGGRKGKAEKGKGGKTGKAEKAREKGKSEESLCQISVEIWQKLSISDRTQPECRLSFSLTGTPRLSCSKMEGNKYAEVDNLNDSI